MGFLSWSVQRYGTDWKGREVGLSRVSGSGYFWPEEYTTECYENLKYDFYSLREESWANTDTSGTQGKGCSFVRCEEMKLLLQRHFWIHAFDEDTNQMKFPFYIALYGHLDEIARAKLGPRIYGRFDETGREKPKLIIQNEEEWIWDVFDFLLPAPDVDEYNSLDYDEEFNSWGQAEEEVVGNISDIIYCVQHGLDWVDEWGQRLN